MGTIIVGVQHKPAAWLMGTGVFAASEFVCSQNVTYIPQPVADSLRPPRPRPRGRCLPDIA